MLIPFPVQQPNDHTYVLRSDKLTAHGFFVGDEITIAPGVTAAPGDWVLIRTPEGSLQLRRFDPFCKNLNILGKLLVLVRHF